MLEPRAFSHSLKGIRIAQLSDLHFNKKVKISYLRSLMQQINEKKVDIVVITGDIIETSALKIEEQLGVFKYLEAPTYYITGNHDIFYGHKDLKKILEKYKVLCLDNTSKVIEIKGSKVQLVGLSDRYSFARNIKRPIKELFTSLDSNLFTLLLAHQPKDCEHIKNTRIDVQLSGHTHGGQVFPLSLLVRLVQPYFKGIYLYNKTLLYVSKGLGYWGVGFRYKVKSEIGIFTIT